MKQISVGLALGLLATVKPPQKLGVYAMRRLCRYRGVKSWHGRYVSHLSRAELIAALRHHGGLPKTEAT